MKFADANNEQQRAFRNYIDSRWRDLQSAVGATFGRIVNYLFVLNTGALLAALTYIATKTKAESEALYCPIRFFVAGIAFITIHAAIDYYSLESHFRDFRKSLNDFYSNGLTWADFLKRDSDHGKSEWILHTLGWLSGLSFFLGLFGGIKHL